VRHDVFPRVHGTSSTDSFKVPRSTHPAAAWHVIALKSYLAALAQVQTYH